MDHEIVMEPDIINDFFSKIGPPDMSSNINTSCMVLSADMLWTTGFHGGKQQQFYVFVLDVKTRITKIYNTHKFGNEKNEDKAYNIALLPGLYSFRILVATHLETQHLENQLVKSMVGIFI